MLKCAIWATATSEPANQGQGPDLSEWARAQGLEVVRVFAIAHSDWALPGYGNEESEYDAARAELVEDARHGRYQVILIWALDQLSRHDADDALQVVRQLAESGIDVRSHQEPWLRTDSPQMRELLAGILDWRDRKIASRRSEQIKAGLARRKAEGKPVGGRKPGARDRTPRSGDGYAAMWAEGGRRREAVEHEPAARESSRAPEPQAARGDYQAPEFFFAATAHQTGGDLFGTGLSRK